MLFDHLLPDNINMSTPGAQISFLEIHLLGARGKCLLVNLGDAIHILDL